MFFQHRKTIPMTSNLLDQLISRFLPWKTVFFPKLLGRWKKYDILRSSVKFKENVCEIKSFRHDFRPDLVTFSLNFHRFEHSWSIWLVTDAIWLDLFEINPKFGTFSCKTIKILWSFCQNWIFFKTETFRRALREFVDNFLSFLVYWNRKQPKTSQKCHNWICWIWFVSRNAVVLTLKQVRVSKQKQFLTFFVLLVFVKF